MSPLKRALFFLSVWILFAGCGPEGCGPEGCSCDCRGGGEECISDLRVLLNEVMFDPSGADEGYEWIELYNAGTGDADVSGWSLAWFNKADDPKDKLSLPDGTVIPAGGFFVVGGAGVEEADLEAELVLGNGAKGDGLHLRDSVGCVADALVYSSDTDAGTGEPSNDDGIVDETGEPAESVAAAASSNHVLARCEDGVDTDQSAEDFRSCEAGSPGESNEGCCYTYPDPCPADATVMLSEVMPHPDTLDQPTEYFEVHNAGEEPIPAACVVLYEGAFGEDEELGRTSDCSIVIPSGGYQVFTKSPEVLADQLGVSEDDLCPLTMSLTDDELFGVGFVDADGAKQPLESVDCGDVDCPVSEGVSMNRHLGELLDGQVGGPGTWCASEEPFYEDDDAVEHGTPGTQNESCGGGPDDDCPAVATLMLSEVMPHPSTHNQTTEFIEIYNAGAASVPAGCVVIYEGTFSAGEGETGDCDLEIPPGDYLVFADDPEALAPQMGVPEDEICGLTMALTDSDLFGVGYLDIAEAEQLLEYIDCAVEDCPVSEGVSMNRDLAELQAGQVGGPGIWCESQSVFYEDDDMTEHGTPGEENEGC